MSGIYLICFIVAVLLVIYLCLALLKPEWF
jgi:K+-transporting ATPase KdpF subunit